MVDLSLVRSQDLWYIIGLITTDGNLSKDGRHINITSKDRCLLLKVKKSLGLKNKITWKANGIRPDDKIYSVLQIGDKKFYNFLLGINLVPKKSLVLGRLKIPDSYFKDFFRGVIDGDGSISNWVHKTNKNQQWSLKITSGSENFVRWLEDEIKIKFKAKGKIYGYKYKNKKNFIYNLKFGKFATKVILKECYYENCLALNRKLKQAQRCLAAKDGLSKYGEVIWV